MSDALKMPALHRAMAIEIDASDEQVRAAGDERIPIALSSEHPVLRSFGYEILDHSPEGVDLARATGRGLPLLLDHDPSQQIGRIEDVSVGPDRKIRGKARFSRSARAQEVRQDVLDGIRTDVSVGYHLTEMDEVKRGSKSEPPTYRAKWMPYEGSLVAVPADPTVGVGRDSDEALRPVLVRSLAPDVPPEVPAAPPTEPAPEARSVTVPEESAAATGAAPNITVTRDPRDEQYRELAVSAEQHGLGEIFSRGIAADKAPAAIRAEMMAALAERAQRGPVIKAPVELTEREEKRYSLVRAIAAAAGEGPEASFEQEIHEELMRKLGRSSSKGFLFPTNLGRAGLDSATSTKGTELKFDVPGSFIDMLRNRSRVMQAGATFLGGLSGPVTFPKQNGAGTASWVGENPGSDVGESNLTLTTASLTAKTLQSTTSFSKQLLRQAVVDVENLVRSDLAAIHALAIDLAAINGSGASNQPQGVLQNTSVNVVAIGTNGGAATYAHMVNLEKEVEADNADIGGRAYITTPGVKAQLKQTQIFSSTDGSPVWSGGQEGQVNGYAAYATNQVPSNLTKGTSTTVCHAVLYGVWSQLYVGEWGAAEILVDPFRLKKQGMVEITSFQMVDIMLRHPEAFAVLKDVTVS